MIGEVQGTIAADMISVPSFADWQQLWQELERSVVREDLKDDAIHNLVGAFRGIYDNGGAELACFKFPVHELMEWSRARNRLGEVIKKFVLLPQVQTSGPPFQPFGDPDAKLDLESSHSLVFDGEIAKALVFGGAYTQFCGSGRIAKELASKFCHSLFQDRFEDITIYKSHAAWSGWFKDVAWDRTWFCFDSRDRRLSVLSTTDTD